MSEEQQASLAVNSVMLFLICRLETDYLRHLNIVVVIFIIRGKLISLYTFTFN